MRQDFLKECMSDPALVKGMVPIDEFNRVYCLKCFQKECERSAAGGTLFTRRVENWKTDLFEKPPRAKDDDPKYAGIRAKKFLQMAKEVVELRANGVNYEVQTSEMPELPQALRPKEAVAAPPAVETEPEVQDPPSVPAPPGPLLEAPAPPPPPVEPARVPSTTELQNTPFDQGAVLPGGESEEKVAEVGGTYVFGSDE